MEQYAYIRVSTKEQNIDRQILALKPYQISKKNIYRRYSGDQPQDRKTRRTVQQNGRGDLRCAFLKSGG